MHNTDMHHAYIKSLILVIGGKPGPNTKAYLDQVSKQSGVGYSSLRAAYYGRWISKNQFVSNETLKKLEQAAENARQTYDIVAFTELQISIWETTPELSHAKIALARDFIADLRRHDAERSRISIEARSDEPGTAAEAAGFAAAAAET
jgi:hypothetical protein